MATISTVNGKKITKIKYKGEIYDTGGSGVNPLQYIIDNHKGDGQPSGEDLFYEYWGSSLDDAINSCDFSKITSAQNMFYDCKNLTSIPYFDMSSCTITFQMFNLCSNLTTIPQLNTSKVKNMNSMFQYCSNLITIPQLDTSNCNMLKWVFAYCFKLTTIDITHMNITSAYDSDNFARECHSLTKLIIRNMTTLPQISSIAFIKCYHFTGTTDATYNPQGLKDGRIYVPDDKVEALKAATNWSVYVEKHEMYVGRLFLAK